MIDEIFKTLVSDLNTKVQMDERQEVGVKGGSLNINNKNSQWLNPC